MKEFGSNAIRSATVKLTKLLDPFGEPTQAQVRLWRIESLIQLCGRLAQQAYQKIFLLGRWYLLFDLRDQMSTSFGSFREIVPPKDRFWADPQVVQVGGYYYIFVEEYIHRLRKGHISVIQMDEYGDYQEPFPVLEKPYHLSYPSVFQWQGKYYMVPESAGNATIDLYECIEFPRKWELKISLMQNVYAVDPTLFYYHEKWWLFAGIAEDAASLPRVYLHLFFSDDLLTNKWISHPRNPIITTAKRGRPAGRVLTVDGRTFRPSQDSSKGYGYGLDLNEILLLSETDYVERNALSIRPSWDPKARGAHTFAHEGRLTMIDAFTRISRL